VKSAALELGLQVLQPPSLRGPGIVDQLRRLEPQVMVAVAYGQILRPEVLAIAPRGVLNVHPSLLPRWRGASPIPAAILAGDSETGVTIMLMDEGMDTGPMLAQRRTPLSGEDTTASLFASLAEEGASLLAETLPRWLAGEVEPQPQDDALATVSRQITKDDGRIDWSLPAMEIWRRIRAYNPWPAAFTTLSGETISIWQARPLDASSGADPGTVVPVRGESGSAAFAVQTGNGLLAVLEAQRAGRKRLATEEFLRGMPGLVGSVLG
jgi:methionyl-tRNA formyltransferase